MPVVTGLGKDINKNGAISITMSRIITIDSIQQKVASLITDANIELNSDAFTGMKNALRVETNSRAIDILSILIENAKMAAEKRKPLCQDTGIGVFFVEIGQDVRIQGGELQALLNGQMSKVYRESPFRLSVVRDPLLFRENTNNNSPAVIHWQIVPGDRLKITFMPKGGGAENMSRIKMFNPLTQVEEVKDFIVDTVKLAGGRPCPPVIVGIGIGGTFDYVAYLAKRALLRPINEKHSQNDYAVMEDDLFKQINSLDIGPMGLGGKSTCLGVNIETYPCHIASLPVAVNLQCHAHRYKSLTI